jgi:hypothetical protein
LSGRNKTSIMSAKMRKAMQSREVRVHEKFYQPVNITSSSTAANLGTLDFGSLFSASTNLLNLGDMFRLFRINKAKFLLRWEEGPSMTQYHFPSSVLYILPFDAAAPTSLANLEQALAVGPLHPSRIMHATELTHNGTGGAADPTLSVQHSDLVVIDSASPSGWLATSADGGQTSFGTLYRLTYAAGSSAPTAAPGWNLEIDIDISFRDLVDSALLSNRKKSRVVAAVTATKQNVPLSVPDIEAVPATEQSFCYLAPRETGTCSNPQRCKNCR